MYHFTSDKVFYFGINLSLALVSNLTLILHSEVIALGRAFRDIERMFIFPSIAVRRSVRLVMSHHGWNAAE